MMNLSALAPVGNRIGFKRSNKEFGDLFPGYAVVKCASGTAALALAIEQAKVNRNVQSPEVILPAYGCPDLVAACVHAKVKPVLVDLAPNSPWMQLEQVNDALTDNTVAILAVTFLGIKERLEDLRAIVAARPITIIEDSAQWFPHLPHDSFESDLVVLSFGRGKPVSMTGGGALLGKHISKSVRMRVNHGETQKASLLDKLKYRAKATLFNIIVRPSIYGIFTRLPFLSIGETRYKGLDTINAMPSEIELLLETNCKRFQSRKDKSDRLSSILAQQKFKDAGIIDLGLLCGLSNDRHHLRFPILFATPSMRDECAERMNAEGLGASKMYGTALHRIEGVESRVSLHLVDNEAENFAKRILTLPTHEFVSDKSLKQIEAVLSVVAHQYSSSASLG